MNVSEKLFGRVGLHEATGEHSATRERLLSPFEHPESITRLHCRGCDSLYELKEEGAEQMARAAGRTLDDISFTTHYFACDGCAHCDGDPHRVEVEDIPPLTQ